MATIKVKRSAVAGRVPATTDLELGEIAINTYDGVAYVKKNVSGTETVVQLGSANLSQNLQNRYQYTATAAQTTFSAVYLAPYVDVYLNGIRLIAGVDYTATNGTTVVLATAASLNNTIDIVAYTSYTANANFADLISSHVTTALGYTPENPANKGAVNGYASLNSSGQIPSAQLPSFVDDVIEYANLAALPATGESGKIYVTTGTNKTYRWSGSAYTEIASSPGSTDAVTEGSSNLYFTNARARNALSATQNLTYSSSTGVFTGPDLSSYLTSATAASVYAPLANPSFSGSVTSNGTTTLAGNVGIGTTPTTQRLKLGFDTTGRNGINITNFNISAGPAYIAFQGYDWVQSAIWHDRASGGALQFAVNPNTTDLSVNGCVVAATFLNNGNFGIGTTSPLGKLHISTTDMLSARKAYSGLGNTGAGDGIFEAYRLDGPLNYLRVLDIVSLGDSANNRGSETRFFTTNTSGVTAERVKIDSSGNFGIGTNSPQSLLHLRAGGTTAVNGGIGLTISHNSNAIANATDALFAGVTIQRDKSSALADGDSLGGINWGKLIAGELRNSVAAIGAIQAGTGESAHLTFYTSPHSRAPVERLRISEVGAFGLSGANYGTTGQVLTSQGSGSAPTWAAAGGGGTPAGSTGQIQFNNGGSFAASGSLTWDNTGNKLAVACSPDVLNQGLTVGGIISMNSNWKLAFSYNPVFYISPSGNDTTGDGSNANPWATINRAMGAVPKLIPSGASFCEIILKNGTYTLPNIQYIRGVTGRGILNIRAETSGSVTINCNGYYFEIFENGVTVSFNGITFNQAGGGTPTQFNINNTFKVIIENSCAINNLTSSASPGYFNAMMSVNNSQIECKCNITVANEAYYGAVIHLYGLTTYYFSGTITKTGSRHGNAAFAVVGAASGTFQNTINNFNIGVNMGQSHYDAEQFGIALANNMSITNCNIGVRMSNGGNFKNYYTASFSGTTTPVYHQNGWHSGTASSEYNLIGYNTSVSSSYRLQVNSQIYATSSTVATSDGRYKKDVENITGALDIVKLLRPVQFKWKPHHTHNFDLENTTVGFIAQDVQQVLADKPYLNSIIKKNEFVLEAEEYDTIVLEPAKDEVYDETGRLISSAILPVTEKRITKPAVTEEFLGIAEGNLIAILTAAIQELKSEFDAYKASHP